MANPSTKTLDLISRKPSPFVVNPTKVTESQVALYTQFRDLELDAYLRRTPSARKVLELFQSQGCTLINDHVALRCFSDAKGGSGLKELEKVYLHFGYTREDNIPIASMHLNCYWYEPPQGTNWPKVFISEQQTETLPEAAKKIVYEVIGNCYSPGPVDSKTLNDANRLYELIENPAWKLTSKQYDQLLAVDPKSDALQYTAWTLVHGNRWNHFTILQNTLGMQQLKNLEDLNAYLKTKGFTLNMFGTKEIQGSSQRFLKQSSTVADLAPHTFADGVTRLIPGSFVEFIERFEQDGVPMRGFLADNARGIFGSTNTRPGT